MRKLLVIMLALLVSACGFQLRGSASLPFTSVFVEGGSSDLTVDLRRAIHSSGTKIMDTAQGAEAILLVTTESREKRILTLTSAGRVSEFQLVYRLGFRVNDAKGKEFLANQDIELKRDFTFNDSEILSKESEESLLYRDMENDAVQQVLRRMSAIKR
jgi:LPS-assembly lipoprotein